MVFTFAILYGDWYIFELKVSSCTTLGIRGIRSSRVADRVRFGVRLRIRPLGTGIFKRMKILIVLLKPLGQILKTTRLVVLQEHYYSS